MKKIINETMLNYKILFIVIAICLITGAGVLYRYESKTLIQDGRTHLLQTADMKALLLSNWVKERNNDAIMIMVNSRLSNDLNQWLNNRSITSKKKMIADRIKTVNHSGTYDVAVLLDNAGNIIMPITGVIEDLASPTRKLAIQAVASGKITWDDLYYCDYCKKEEINIFVPLHSDEKTGSKTIAVLLLQIDAHKYLIPLIRTQPASSKTNEILLLRAEELDRFKKAKYFNSVFSDDTQLERVIYSNPGSSLIGEFEYHDTKVIAAVKKVSDMPLYIAAKVDRKEAYSSLRILTLTIVFSLIFLITLLGTLIALVVANQKKDLYKRQFDMEVEQKALIKHFDYITKYSNDIFILVEEGGRIVQFNDRALTAYGYNNDEIMGMKVSDFRTDRAMTKYESDFEKAIENGGTLFETEHKCKDGSILPVEISLRSIEIEGKRYFQAIIRDTTERKKIENELRESEEKFHKAFYGSPIAMAITDMENRTFIDVNEGFVKLSGNERSDVIGRPVREIDLWAETAKREEYFELIKKGNLPKNYPAVFRTKRGERLDILLSAEMIVVGGKKCLLISGFNITDRTQMENRLRASQERYRQLFENNNDAIYVHELNEDGPGLFIAANRKAEKMLGYTRQELLGMTMLDITTPEHQKELLGMVRLLKEKKHVTFETEGITKTGQNIPSEISLHLFGLEGRPVVMVVIRDITQRKKDQEALLSERMLFIGGPSVAFQWFAKEGWPVEYVSPNVEEQFGYKPEEFISGRRLYASIVHPDDLERVGKEVEDYSRYGVKIFEQEYRILKADGQYCWVHDFTVVKRNTQGEITHYHGYIIDITSRKRAEEALHESELRFRTVAQSANDAIIAADNAGRIVFWNNAAGNMYGYNEQEVVGKPITILMPEKYREAHLRRIEKLQENKSSPVVGRVIESEGLRKDRTVFPAEYSVSTWQTKEGKYFTAIVRNITERKAAAAALEMSEYRYRTTLDAVNEMIHVIDQDYNILLMNEAFKNYCQVNGICDQCVGKNVFEVFPFLSQSVRDEYEKVFETKKVVLSEDVNIVNGKEIITKTRKIPILEDDRVVRIVTVITDVTDAKKQEEAIKESREKYQSIFDNSHDGIFIIKGHSFYDCNEYLVKMFSLNNKDEIIGKTPADFSPEYQANGMTSNDYATKLIDNAYAGAIIRFEWKHTRKTGEIFDCEISLNRLELKGEYYLMAILRDVTEKKEVEDKLLENEQRYTIVVEKTGHLVYDYDVATGKIKWSGAVKEVTGYGNKEIEKIGIKEWEDLIHPDDKEFVLNHLESCLSTVSSFDIEYRFKRADGQYIFVLDHGVFLPGKDGKAARMLGTMSDVSERKQMDIALKQSEEKYKTLFTDTLEALSITKKGIIYDVNAAWLKLHKYENKDEVVGRDITEILAPQDRCVIIERRERVFSNDTERIFEVRDLTKAGEIIEVEVSSSTISLDGEEAIISAVQNISQDKMKERKIRELNKRFEYVLGATKTGFDIIDASYSIHYIDPEWEKVYGNNAGEKCYEYFMGRETPCESCGVDAALRTKQTTITEEFLAKEKRWIEVHTIPFQDEDGKWLVAEFNIDITQRKQDQKIMENRQKALQEVYKIATSLDETFQGICDRVAINLSQILDVPHMAVQLLKNGKINVISYCGEGKIANNMTLPLEGSPCEQAYQKEQFLEINGSLRQLFPKFFLNEMYDLNSYLGMPIKDRKGRVLGLICMYDYWQHNFNREEIVLLEIFAHYIGYEVERSELENNLREADKGKLLSDIASGVAHEVRNPLHAIQAITEAMAQDFEDNPNFAEYLMHIKLQVGRLSQLMKELLELGKPIPASEFKRELVSGIVATAIKYWQDAQTEQNNNVELLNIMDKDKYIYADDAKIQEVVINLLDNAAQHSPAGKAITIELTQQGHEYVTVKIIDQGSGVKPQTEERIFEPFYTTRKKGTGLGLAICKRIIESHGGNIQLMNNIDMPGCTVQFTLPFCKEGKT